MPFFLQRIFNREKKISAVAKQPGKRCYELKLEDGMPRCKEGQVIYLPAPTESYVLRLVIPCTSKVVYHGALYSNYPPRGKMFDRKYFYKHQLVSHGLARDTHIDIEIHRSGTFIAYMTYEEIVGHYGETRAHKVSTEQWSFIVQCSINVGKNDEKVITPNSLCVQTVLSKSLGSRDRWDVKWKAIADKGYNMIHFVPLQKRGESDSPFSISDQLAWDAACFPSGEEDVKLLVKTLKDKYGIAVISDIVLNHTANNSPWLKDHPEAGYSVATSPHLEPVLALEDALLQYSEDLGKQNVTIGSAGDIESVVVGINKLLESIKFWEFYVLNIDALVEEAQNHQVKEEQIPKDVPQELNAVAAWIVAKGASHFTTFSSRFSRIVDTFVVAQAAAASGFSARELLTAINMTLYAEYNSDVQIILQNIENRLKYLRLDNDGPKMGKSVSRETPIIEPYFTRLETSKGEIALINNGWIWAANPAVDFAGPKSKAYLLREVVIWGDCVKLRYGHSPSDNPYLWKRMSAYARMLAKVFAGLRIDNCHSTPSHVGAYILDQARLVKPNLYVVAELFSGSRNMDKLYVESLGINSLLREAMNANNPKELSTLVNINGGLPIGSFIDDKIHADNTVEVSSLPIHSWFMECTHDNLMPAQKRTVEDTLSTAALVAFCMVASGSVVGCDECYPAALDIVTESREYVFNTGISRAKKVLNALHTDMGVKGMIESYTDHQGQYISVHRLNPVTGEGYFVIVRTAFCHDNNERFSDVFLEGSKAQWLHGWAIVNSPGRKQPEETNNIVPLDVKLNDLEPFSLKWDGTSTTICSPVSSVFPQGSVAIFETRRSFDAPEIERKLRSDLEAAVASLDLLDLNYLLYVSKSEERTRSLGTLDVYNIPNYGELPYGGLQGWEHVVRDIARTQDLSHPLCVNLREGMWAFDAIVNRLEFYAKRGVGNLANVAKWARERREAVAAAPSFMRPRYFAAFVINLYDAAVKRAKALLPAKFCGSQFSIKLALTSVQMVSIQPGASLYADRDVPSMAAGLPHFSEGIMRCWGRDIFISLTGLLIELGRLDEAREHILAFASTLKNGLIPNLLDGGKNPRYNCRDAVWFFLQSIQEFCTVTNSHYILHLTVQRRFPLDDRFVNWDSKAAYDHKSTIGQIVYEVLSRHAKGITFREQNAGPNLDGNMRDEGFNQHIYVDWKTGFVHGGNQWNCGTWQDKMGESTLAGNKGVPATPRDGAAVEITGLLKSCLRWINQTRKQKHYSFPEGVYTNEGIYMPFVEWERRIKASFERCYYVPLDSADDDDYDLDVSIIHRRGIYKDLYRSGKPYEDYQLRPNFALALSVAPELFEFHHAQTALRNADTILRGPLGMRTLDPEDWNYRPFYENGVDSTDYATAKGFNYHQGPEWVWQFGVFLRAILTIEKLRKIPKEDIIAAVRNRISAHVKHIENSPWAGLPELTQKDGAYCSDSSPTQAWSSAQLIQALVELEKLPS